MTDTYYNNAKELSKILYNKRIDFKNEDKEFVTFSKIICTREDKNGSYKNNNPKILDWIAKSYYYL